MVKNNKIKPILDKFNSIKEIRDKIAYLEDLLEVKSIDERIKFLEELSMYIKDSEFKKAINILIAEHKLPKEIIAPIETRVRADFLAPVEFEEEVKPKASL